MSLTADICAQLLEGTLDADRPTRTSCEAKLASAKGVVPEYGLVLLDVVRSGAYNPYIRQSAAILLKNFVFDRDWNCESRQADFPVRVRAAIKENIIRALVEAPELCLRQLLITIRCIYMYDSNSHWPTLLPQLVELLYSNDHPVMISALRITRVISKNLEIAAYAEKERALPETFLPVLLKLFHYIGGIAGGQAPPPNISEMIKLIVKILWSCTTSNIPNVLCDDRDIATGWLECLMMTLRLPIHPEAMGNPTADAWRCVKWTAHVVRRWMQLCAVNDSLRQVEVNFSKLFASYEPRFMEVILDVVRSRSRGIPTPAKPFVVSLEIVTLAVAQKRLYNVLLPQIPTLIADNLFPELQFTDADAETWDSNPQEYIRRGNNPTLDVYNEKVVAMHLLEIILVPTKKFHDKTLMVQFLAFLNGQLGTPNPRVKHACHYAIAGLHNHIRSHPASAGHLLGMLRDHVLPDLRSPYAYLRSISFLVISHFTKDLAQHGEPFVESLRIGLDLLFNDTELPVRVAALSGLIRFLRRRESTALIEPHLERLVFLCFKLMKEVDTEDVIATLEKIIDKFGNHLASFTAQLCATLVRHFMDLHDQWSAINVSQEGNDFEDINFGQYESLATASDATLQTLCTLLQSVTHHKEVFAEVQPVVAPLIAKLLDPESIGYLDGALEVMSTVTFHSRPLLPCMWDLFPMMHFVALNGGLDYFTHMLAPIDNYISADPDRFVQTDCVAHLHEMCAAVMDLGKEMTESEMIAAPKLMETLLQHGRGHSQEHLDRYVPRYLDLVVEVLRSRDLFSPQFQLSLFHVILNAMWYNAGLTMDYLRGRGVLDLFFPTYLAFLHSVRNRLRPYDRKVAILGLTSVLRMAPPPLLSQLEEVVWTLLTANHVRYALEDAEIEKALAEGSDDDEDMTTDEEGEEMDGEDGEDDPDMWGRGEQEASHTTGRVRYSQGARVGGEQEDEDEFEDEDFWTVLDDVCEAVVLRDTLMAGGCNMPPQLEGMCHYAVQRLEKRKAYENKVKDEARTTRDQYEKGLGSK